MTAVRGDAAHHRVGEILDRPVADAILRIRRNVGGTRRCRTACSVAARRQAPSRASPSDFGRAWQERAAASPEDPLAAGCIAGAETGNGLGIQPFRFGQKPKRSRADATEHQRGNDQLSPKSQRSAFLDAEGLVTALAALPYRTKLRLQRLQILSRSGSGSGRDFLELVDLSLEAGRVFPDFRRSGRIALVTSGRNDAATSIFCTLSLSAVNAALTGLGVEISFAVDHLHQHANLFSVFLHDGLAVSDHVGECRRRYERQS